MNFEGLRNIKCYIMGELRNELLRNNILILRGQISRNYSFWTLLNIVARMHCLTPFGVRGSLNRDQHSILIFCLTGSGTVFDVKTSFTNGSISSDPFPPMLSADDTDVTDFVLDSIRLGFDLTGWSDDFFSGFWLVVACCSRWVIFFRAAKRLCLKSCGSSLKILFIRLWIIMA